MATLTSSLKLQDRFTRVMRAAYAATTKVSYAMERANATADKADLGRAYSEARRAIDAAEKELDQFEQGMKETDQQAGKTSRGISGWQKAIIVANQGLQLAQRLWSGLTSKMDTSDAIMSVNARLGLINDGKGNCKTRCAKQPTRAGASITRRRPSYPRYHRPNCLPPTTARSNLRSC